VLTRTAKERKRMSPRIAALALAALALAVLGCGRDLGEDAPAPASSGIPMGAPGATGASFAGPPIVRSESTSKKPVLPSVPDLGHLPDPFAAPAPPKDAGTPGKKKGGVNL
jgi:hypothetical protein